MNKKTTTSAQIVESHTSPIPNGTFVYKMIEHWESPYNYYMPYLLEGVIVDSHEYNDDFAYTVKWVAGAPADVVEDYGLDEEVYNKYNTNFYTDPEAAMEDYILFTSEYARKRLAMLKEAKAAGKTVTFPKSETSD